MNRTSQPFLLILLVFSLVIFFTSASYAFRERTEKNSLEKLEFKSDEFYISQSTVPVEQLFSQLSNAKALQNLLAQHGGFIYIDPRSGRPSSLTATIPLIPGTGSGNKITFADISAKLGYPVTSIGEKEIRAILLKFIQEHAAALNINIKEIGTIRTTQIEDLWQVSIRRESNGIPVRGAFLSLAINHGNVSLWGLDNWGDIDVNLQLESHLIISADKKNQINSSLNLILN